MEGGSRPGRTWLNQPTRGGTGGNVSILARSATTRSTGRAMIVRTTRRYAPSSQSGNSATKTGWRDERVTRHERRLEQPVATLHGHFGLRVMVLELMHPSRQHAAELVDPGSDPVGSTDAGLAAHSNRRGTRPNHEISYPIPNNRSDVRRVGNIAPSVSREYAAAITSTGNNAAVPPSSGIRGRSHRSHCAASPGAHASRRPNSYFGGSVDFTALVTVLRETLSRSAIRAAETPSAATSESRPYLPQ